MLPIGAAARIPQKPSAVNSFQRIGQQPFTSLFTMLDTLSAQKFPTTLHSLTQKRSRLETP